MITCKSYIGYEAIPEIEEIFVYGIKHVKTNKVDNCILIGCECDVLYENNKLFNFWSNRFINKEIEKRDFQITNWPFLTLVKRNNFFSNSGVMYSIENHQPNQKPINFLKTSNSF